jgi:hypothetical protein
VAGVSETLVGQSENMSEQNTEVNCTSGEIITNNGAWKFHRIDRKRKAMLRHRTPGFPCSRLALVLVGLVVCGVGVDLGEGG